MTSVVDAPLGEAAPTTKVGAASPLPARTRGRHAAEEPTPAEVAEPHARFATAERTAEPTVEPAVEARPDSMSLLQRLSIDRPDWGPTTFGPTVVDAGNLSSVSRAETPRVEVSLPPLVAAEVMQAELPRPEVVLPEVVLPELTEPEAYLPEAPLPEVSLNRAAEIAAEQAPAFVRALIEDPQVQQELANEQVERAMLRAAPEQLALESKEQARYRARHSAPPSLAVRLSHVGTFFVRRGTSIAITVALLATIVGILGCFVGAAMGYRGAVVLSGSMRPTMQVGALVISRSVSPEQLHPGDLVTFRSPALHNQSVTHRIVSMHRDGATMDFETRGDANKVSEHWQVPVNSKLGLGVFHVNYVGRWLSDLGSSLGRSIAVLLIAAAALTLILRRLWRADAESEEELR
ncbi:signal peptidase I [Frankineae bacterium MT45]|nr:signal peptidase I [Frankineae bacterium MT45]